MSFRLVKVRESKDTSGRYDIDICADNISNSLWTISNKGVSRASGPDGAIKIVPKTHIKQWSFELERIPHESGLEERLENPQSIGAIEDGLLVCDSGTGDSPAQVFLLSRDGKRILPYFSDIDVEGAFPKKIIPVSESSAYIIYHSNDNSTQSLYLAGSREPQLVVQGNMANAVTSATFWHSTGLYFVISDSTSDKRSLVRLLKPTIGSLTDVDLFPAYTDSRIRSMAIHPNGTMIFACEDGYIHCYDMHGKRISPPFNTGARNRLSHAITVNAQGRIYFTATDFPVIEIQMKET